MQLLDVFMQLLTYTNGDVSDAKSEKKKANKAYHNAQDAKDAFQHCGPAWGHYGLTNIWFRYCHFTGVARYAVYFDGPSTYACNGGRGPRNSSGVWRRPI